MAFFCDLDLEKRKGGRIYTEWRVFLTIPTSAIGPQLQTQVCLMVAIPISCNLLLYPSTLNELSATYLQTLGEAHTLVSILGSQKPQDCWAINTTVIPDSRKLGLGPSTFVLGEKSHFLGFHTGLREGLWTSSTLGSSGSAVSPVSFTFASTGHV